MIQPPLRALSLVLRALPDHLHAELTARLTNHLLKGQYAAEQLQDLEGKRLCLGITDTGNELTFTVRNGKLARARSGAWDVRIAGRLADLWLLAGRGEDPDTLFFNRRLTLEGETEAGLFFKNFLDGLEFDAEAHLAAVLGEHSGRRVFALLRRSALGPRLPGIHAS